MRKSKESTHGLASCVPFVWCFRLCLLYRSRHQRKGETEIGSVSIEVDFLLRKNKNFTDGEVVAADRSKYKIIKQGWYKQGDDPLQDPACFGLPEMGTDYFLFCST